MSLDNRGKTWSLLETQTLKDECNQGLSLEAIAELHKRSRYAIECKMDALGIVSGTEPELNKPEESEESKIRLEEGIEIILKSIDHTLSNIFIVMNLYFLYSIGSRFFS